MITFYLQGCRDDHFKSMILATLAPPAPQMGVNALCPESGAWKLSVVTASPWYLAVT